MNKEQKQKPSSHDKKVIHIKIIGGTQADVVSIGSAFQEFKKKLPFEVEAFVTDDRVELRDVDALLRELWKLKKQIDQDKTLE